MASSVDRTGERMPAKSDRADSLPVRTNSRPLRMDAKHEFLADVNEARTILRKSVEAMAIDAECPISQMSDALAGKDGRNFAGHWLTAQGDEFVDTFNRVREARRGVTPAAKRAKRTAAIVEALRMALEEAM